MQFTSEVFTSALRREDITICMDGRGRAFDNIFVGRLWLGVRHENVYLNDYGNRGALMLGRTASMIFYKGERAYQSLGYHTPSNVCETGTSGGAMIVDKFFGARGESSVPPRSTEHFPLTEEKTETTGKSKTTAKSGQRRAAACETECTA